MAVFKCTMAKIIALITILFFSGYQVKAVSLMEGQEATFQFPYPCDSTEVTLQQWYRAPFYRSSDGSSLSLSQDQVERFKVQNRNDTDNCSLDLTISDLMRSDEGTYLSTIYKDRQLLDDYTTIIWLQVDYPPGKASCVVSEGKGEDWVSIDCTADVGSLSGKIECYQDGVWMPPLTHPIETDTLLKQTILIRKSQPAFCCSSAWIEHKERCECDDTALYLNDAISNDPCPTISTKTSTTSTYRTPDLVEKSQSSDYPLPSHTTSTNAYKMPKSILISRIIYYIGLAILIIKFVGNAIYFYQLRQERKNNSNDESQNLKAIIIFYISGTGLVILLILNTISVYLMWPKNNSYDDESHYLKAIFIHVDYSSAIGLVILFILNEISFCHINQPMQERKQTSNGESQDPSLSTNVHSHCVQQCETDKLNQMMMQELVTHKTQNIA